ncbi:hypothetical protein N7467_011930 [Penicillium canescens]|nr:hypothetical protein N7467_011930 [Penicillium canescens]
MHLHEEYCDVLIIGSGPIGATYAKEILQPESERDVSQNNPKVIMVEAGAQESKIPGEHKKNAVAFQKQIDSFVNGKQNFNGQNQEQDIYSNLDANAVSRNVGGMSTHWTCATPRQHKEIERSPIFDDNTWEKLYKRAEQLIGTDTEGKVLEKSIRQRLVLDILRKKFEKENRDVRPLPLAAKKVEGKNLITWSSTSTVLGDLLDYNPRRSPLLELRDEHICERLETEIVDGVPKVTSAIVKALAKPRSRAHPEDKIRIRARSGFRSKDKNEEQPEPSNAHLYLPALGRSLTEQTMCFCQIVLKDEWIKKLQTEEWGEECDAHRKKFDKDADPLQIPFDDLDPQVTLPVGPGHEWHTQIHRDAFSYGAVPPAIDTRTIVDLRYFGQAKPKWENRVKFSKKLTDAYGMPQPTFFYKPDEEDRLKSHAMMKDMEKVAGELGGYLPGSEPQFLSPGLALHVCGTTKSKKRVPDKTDNQQKDDSCCDETSKIWGIENLYVGGLNVISGPNASNPTLTAMCHAIKGAEAIRHKLKPEQES